MTPKLFDNSRHYESLKDVCCAAPSTDFHIYNAGVVTNCCYSWLPTYVGNVLESTLLEIINGTLYQDVKKSVTDGSFKYCSTEYCPRLTEKIHKNTVSQPLFHRAEFEKIKTKKIKLFFNYDKSCNLYCGSCRNERIIYTENTAPNDVRDIHRRVQEQIVELEKNGYEVTLHITGSGDPYGSPLYWNLLQNIKADTKFTFELSTNGTLMTKEKLMLPYAKKTEFIGISVDAFTAETYSKVRRGGSFSALQKNIADLDQMVDNGELPNLHSWLVNFVVQKDNYKEMADFARWALKFTTIRHILYLVILDWGHLSKAEYSEKAVWEESHPEHSQFLEVLKDPIFDDPKIFLGSCTSLRNKALNKSA